MFLGQETTLKPKGIKEIKYINAYGCKNIECTRQLQNIVNIPYVYFLKAHTSSKTMQFLRVYLVDYKILVKT